MSFLLLFDLSQSKASLRVKIHRELIRIGASMIQQSVWEHTNFNQLKAVTDLIKDNGGRGMILKKRVIYQ